MTRLATLFAVLLLGSVADLCAQGIEFFSGTYREALALAKEQDKLVFIDAYAEWCAPCRRMSNQVFPNAAVGEVFNESFVNMKLDMERGEGKKFNAIIPVSSYPTLLWIDGDGKLVQRVLGAQDAPSFIKHGQAALRKTDKSAIYAAKYRRGDRDPQLVLAYVRSLNRAGKASLQVTNEFLRDNTEHGTPEVQAIIFEGTRQIDSRVFKIFIEQRAALEATYGAQAVRDRIALAAERTMESALRYDSDALMQEAKSAVEQHLPSHLRTFDAKADLAVAKNRKDAGLAYKAAKKVVLADGNSPAANHQMAVELYRYFPDQPKAMALATKMAGTAAKGNPSFDNLFTYAQLLAATDKDKKARAQAEAAMRKLEGDESDSRRAAMVDQLLGQLQG